jgi:type IV pilus assembly protein PilB
MPIVETTLKKLIVNSNLVAKTDLQLAYTTSQHLGCSIADVLLGRDLITEEGLGNILSKHYEVKFVDLAQINIPKKILIQIPESLAAERGVIAFDKKKSSVSLAMEDPKDLDAIELVRKTIGGGTRIIPHVATTNGIKIGLKLYKTTTRKDGEDTPELTEPETTSAVTLIDKIVEDAIREDASDIHFESLSERFLVRFRIDGVLHDRMALPQDMHASLIARIKILAEMKIDENRLPQDGRFPFTSKRGEKISLRVSTVPAANGEKAVLRILHDTLTKFNLEELGFLPEDQEVIRRTLERTNGMFLATGPTGSGKTTTLYTLLGLLNRPGVNILTIEDPIENRVHRLNQIQVNPQINLTFAQGLRSILRQDPDIIMVGEIRDTETAVISVNAAMTGHFVFSTVHANNAAGAIPRMLNLETEPFLLASTLNMVVAQRLVRMVCSHCAEDTPITPLIAKKLDEAKDQISSSVRKALKINIEIKGCSQCNFTGYRGRTGIFEVVLIDDKIQKLITSKPDANSIWKVARKSGAKTMLEDGLIKVAKKITTIEEVLRVSA